MTGDAGHEGLGLAADNPTLAQFEQITAEPSALAGLLLAAFAGDSATILRAAGRYQDAVHGLDDTGVIVDLDAYRRAATGRHTTIRRRPQRRPSAQ